MHVERETLAAFFRKLGHLLKAEVGLILALTILQDDHAETPVGPALARVIEGVLGGRPFSEALADHAGLFGRDAILLMEIAEDRGRFADGALNIGDLVAGGTLAVPPAAGEVLHGWGVPACVAAAMADGPTELIAAAVRHGATDLHLERQPGGGTVRMRVGGELRPLCTLDHDAARRLLVRLKLLSALDVTERRLPQDGRVRMRVEDREVRFAVSILPSPLGEAACLRFDPPDGPGSTGPEYFGDRALAGELAELARTRGGLLLITGPAGSGKTTTLYALLRGLDLLRMKVVSIEDPVRMLIPGVHQVACSPWLHMTAAAILRSAARVDADVISTNRIPDAKTGELLLRAAFTGRAVIAELTAPDAATALTRLTGMGVEPAHLADGLSAILVQRRDPGVRPAFTLVRATPALREQLRRGQPLTELRAS